MIHAQTARWQTYGGGDAMVIPLDWSLRLPPPVLITLEKLEQAGFEAWLVGGCVRDLAIGRTPLDFERGEQCPA